MTIKDEWLQKMIDDAAVREAASVELQRGIDELIQEAVAVERERCAEIADRYGGAAGLMPTSEVSTARYNMATEIAAAIRKGRSC